MKRSKKKKYVSPSGMLYFTPRNPWIDFPYVTLEVPGMLIKGHEVLRVANAIFQEYVDAGVPENEMEEMRERFFDIAASGGGFGIIVRPLNEDGEHMDMSLWNMDKMDQCRAETAIREVEGT
jgi:hypothetical protein